MANTERNIGLDMVRIIACFLVVLYHVPQYTAAVYEFHDIGSRALNTSMFYVGRCAVPLFFILSGYLLLPIKAGTSYFFKKRLTRIVVPAILWFLIFNVVGKEFDNPNNSFWIAKTPHFWYIYALLGIYLVLPIMSIWYRNSTIKEKLFYLLLWVTSLLIVVINEHFPITLQYNHQGMLYNTPFQSLLYVSGYIGYFLVGAMIRDNMEVINMYLGRIILFSLVLYVILIVAFRCYAGVSNSNSIAYVSLTTCLLSSTIFILLNRIGGRIRTKVAITYWGKNKVFSIMEDVSNATFPIYFMHVLFLEYIPVETIGGYSRLIICTVVFISSYFIYKILSVLPNSKYLLG